MMTATDEPPRTTSSRYKNGVQRTRDERERAVRKVLLKLYPENPAENLTLEKIHTDSRSLTYACPLPQAEQFMRRVFCKATFIGNHADQFVSDRKTAWRMTNRHDWVPRYLTIYIAEEKLRPFDRKLLIQDAIRPIRPLEIDESKNIIVEVQEFGEGIPYSAILNRHRDDHTISEMDHAITDALVASQCRIHSVKPLPKDLGVDSKDPEDPVFQKELAAMHRKSILSILDRMNVHAPPDREHPFITEKCRHDLFDIGIDITTRWSSRADRSCAQQGDQRAGNLLVDDSEKAARRRESGTYGPNDLFDKWGKNLIVIEHPIIRPIDFQRVAFCDRGFDDGRFIADILEYYVDTKNPFYRNVIDHYIHGVKKFTSDLEYEKSLLIGIFSMLFLKIKPESEGGTPIKDPGVAKRYFDVVMNILRSRTFSWI